MFLVSLDGRPLGRCRDGGGAVGHPLQGAVSRQVLAAEQVEGCVLRIDTLLLDACRQESPDGLVAPGARRGIAGAASQYHAVCIGAYQLGRPACEGLVAE